MLTYDWFGPPCVCTANIIENALEHFQQKGAGAAREVTHRDAIVVCQAVTDAEALFAQRTRGSTRARIIAALGRRPAARVGEMGSQASAPLRPLRCDSSQLNLPFRSPLLGSPG